jgi:hypothetical protein
VTISVKKERKNYSKVLEKEHAARPLRDFAKRGQSF